MPSTAPGNDLDLSRRDVADILKVSVKTLAEWERRGIRADLLPPIPQGHAIQPGRRGGLQDRCP